MLMISARPNWIGATLETVLRVNITNGETNGTKLATTLTGALGATDAYCAKKNAPTTGRITGVATLPRSSVGETSSADDWAAFPGAAGSTPPRPSGASTRPVTPQIAICARPSVPAAMIF